ncbi:unnamed protein product, partial [Closterium sp. NIES-54]
QVAAACSCRLLSHKTLLWHHRLGHPSLPRLLLVSGLPRSLPPLPPSPAPPCLPCVEGRQRAAPHSSSFSPTTAPLQTLHMDVWGPTRVSGQGRERYFLQVVDDYTRYTIVFPLRSKGDVSAVLIPWIRTVRLQLRARFGQNLPVLRLHSDRGGEFSSDLLRDFCRGEGITQSFTLPDSPQQNGIAERRIGLVMEVARTSMIHAAAPHFLWPFAVRYVAHQLNLWPHVSLPETSPTLRWTGKVGDASVFRVWGSRAFVRDTSADKLSARAIPCDVTFDESVPFYRLFPYRSAPSPPPPLFLAPGPPPVAVVSGAAPGAASGGAASGGPEPGGAGSEGAWSRGAEPEGVEPWGAESEGAEPEGAESEGAESGGAEPRGVASSRGPAGASPRLSSQQLREWLVQRAHRRSGAPGAGEPGGAGAGGAAFTTRVGDPTESWGSEAWEAESWESEAWEAESWGSELWESESWGSGLHLRLLGLFLLQHTRRCFYGFVPSTADPSLFLRTDTSLPPFYVLVYVDDLVFATVDTEALTLVKSELQKRHTCTDLGELRSYLGLQITRDRARRTITLTQSHMVQQVLQRFGFQYSSPQLTPLSTSHSLSAPPSDESVEPSGPYPELVGCLICEAEIYAGAMAAQELRWLTYLLTDLGEQPRSPPVLYVDNKAMIALCQEHRLEHRTKHIALRYFLARELQQRGQLRLAYMATQANTADVFTKALPPGDHRRFVTVLGLVPTLPHFLTA